MGLFQSIFGKKRSPGGSAQHPYFDLLATFDSGFTPFSGNAWEISIVRAAVDAWARNAAKIQPRHIQKLADGGRADVDDRLNRILQIQPNPYMTAFAFYYKVATQFITDNNAFLFPVFGREGDLEAIYPINAERVELVEVAGDLYARMIFATQKTYTCPYDRLIHLRRHFRNNDIFGDGNRALLPVLETADAFNKSMSKFAKLISVIRGLLKVNGIKKDEDVNAKRDEFIRNNLHADSNGSGVVVTDGKYEYTPVNDKQVPIPVGQLEYVRREVYDYFGVNDAIVQNTADADKMDAFYRGQLAPFYMQLAQALGNCLFTRREQEEGHEILCELDRLQFETLNNRKDATQFLTNIGAVSLDQVLGIFGLPPIGGEEGRRRVQTLNMANVETVDDYQLGKNSSTRSPKEKGEGNGSE